MEPVSGIKPESFAYQANALSLSYTGTTFGGGCRSRTHDELLVGQPIFR